MASSNSLRTCDLCENACYVDLLDGRSVLVCDGTATDESAHEVRETDSCDKFALYIEEDVAGNDE
nr:MAG TPA: hypothetical protein [Caudoviricetes sp.]